MNLALVRLVSTRYRELQGLTTIADASGLLLCGLGLRWSSSEVDVAVFLVASGAYTWLWARRIRPAIDAFYAHRYGRIACKTMTTPIFLTTVVALQMGPILMDLYVPRSVCMAFVALIVAGRPAWSAVRDWPYRVHWLLPAAAGGVVTAGLADIVTFEQGLRWWGTSSLVLGPALMVAGVFDHLLLARTLRPSEKRADARNEP